MNHKDYSIASMALGLGLFLGLVRDLRMHRTPDPIELLAGFVLFAVGITTLVF